MLKGERVVLRPIQRADPPRLWELISDFEVAVLASSDPAFPWSLAGYEAEFEELSAHPPKDRLRLAIEVDGELIGETGLHRIDHFNRRCELGIELGREFWGKGFGQDAVRTMVDYAFEHLNMNRVSLYVLADDPRAVGAYRKAGFVEEGRLRKASWVRGRFEDESVMAIVREEWVPRG